MRAVLLTDESFAHREGPMLARLEVGLIDEGVRVVRAVPASHATLAAPALAAPVVGYTPSLIGLLRHTRARRLARSLAETVEGGGGGTGGGSGGGGGGGAGETADFDVVHCFGERAWGIALELGRLMGAGVALEIWSAACLRRAARLRPRAGAPRPTLIAPDGAIERVLRRNVPHLDVHRATWGVHTPASVGRWLGAPEETGYEPGGMARPVSIALLAGGGDRAGVLTALEGVARAAAELPEVLLFADASLARRVGLWDRARALGLVDRMSLVANLEGSREPILHTDLVLQPEALGEHRSLALDAMAAGALLVARPDPHVEHLIDDRTACIVKTPTAEGWAAAVTGILRDRARAMALRESARAYVRSERSASAHVGAVVRVYAAMDAERPVSDRPQTDAQAARER